VPEVRCDDLPGFGLARAIIGGAPISRSATGGTAMKEEQHQFLQLLGQLPARLTAEQAAWVLNCQSHDVPILVAARLLKPLGNPRPNGIKFFATLQLLELVKDQAWLVKVTNAVNHHWQKNNANKKNGDKNRPLLSKDQLRALNS
jgi:hypothetical protein